MKFEKYLKKQKVNITTFAITNGINPTSLWRVIYKSKNMSLKMASLIVKKTKNEVSFNDLVKEYCKE